MRLTKDQWSRAYGVMLGAASGDALGVPFEFQRALRSDEVPTMRGGGLGPYRPGEWSDDTQMATVILTVAARSRLLSTTGLNAVANGFLNWRQTGASDVGAQTSGVLSRFVGQHTAHARTMPKPSRFRASRIVRAFRPLPEVPAADIMSRVAEDHHNRTGRSGGNGSLMRTAPVALAYLGDRAKCAEAARTVSALTHFDPMAGDLCVIWCEAIRVAVLTGQLDLISGLDLIPADRRDAVRKVIATPSGSSPRQYSPNGYVVTAFQAATASLTLADVDARPGVDYGPSARLVNALYTVIRVGDDTDTTAAITGALAGALYGEDAIPAEWRTLVNGWSPNGQLDAAGLRALTRTVVRRA